MTAMRFGSTSGSSDDEIESADRIPRLQSHEAVQAEDALGVFETAVEEMQRADRVVERLAVRDADHVVGEGHIAVSCERRRQRLQVVSGVDEMRFSAGLHGVRGAFSPASPKRPFAQ